MWGSKCQQPEWDRGSEAHVPVVSATGGSAGVWASVWVLANIKPGLPVKRHGSPVRLCLWGWHHGRIWLLEGPGESTASDLCVCVWMCMCVSVSNVSLPAAGVGLSTSGVRMSRCQELGRLGSRGQVPPKASCWRDEHCIFPCIHRYISHSLTFLLISQAGEQDEAAEAVYVSVMLGSSVCADLYVQFSTYVWYMCIFACVTIGNPRVAVGYGATTASPLSGHQISCTPPQLTICICSTLEIGLELRNFIFSLCSSWTITGPAEGFASPASGVKRLQHPAIIITSTQCLHCNLCLKSSLKISAN